MAATTDTSTEPKPRPSIARIWRGRVKRERADEYEKYNFETGTRPLIQKALGVQSFREDRKTETEFVTISYWESVEAMSRFTGGDPTKIHHLPRDPEFLIEVPKSVQILRIYESHGRIG
ncbi:MAG: antibiotic biosynthesis monooxygenase family protein [Bryobacteraceae bacterium]